MSSLVFFKNKAGFFKEKFGPAHYGTFLDRSQPCRIPGYGCISLNSFCIQQLFNAAIGFGLRATLWFHLLHSLEY